MPRCTIGINFGSVPVNNLTVCSGLPQKDQMLNQIYADVMHKGIMNSQHSQASAVDAALFAAVTAG